MTAPDRKQQFIDQQIALSDRYFESDGFYHMRVIALRYALSLAYDMGALHEREKREEVNAAVRE